MKSTETQDQHYIYKITNNKPTDKRRYYIGVKSSPDPENDNYWGSSDSLKESMDEIGLENFSKEILSTWETREEANAEEVRLHELFDVASSEEYYNKANATSTGFCRFGKVTAIDMRDNSIKDITKEEFHKFEYYVSCTKGQVTVIDNNGLRKNVSLDEYKHNPNLIHNRKGQVPVLDLRDNTMKSVSREDFIKFDYFKHSTSGQATVIDTRDGKTKNVSNDDFKKFDYYVGCTNGQVTVIDTRDGKTKNVTKEEFEKNRIFYKTCSEGKVVVINKKDKSKTLMTKEDLEKNPNYKLFSTKGMMPAIDKRSNKKIMVSVNDYKNNDYYVSRKSKKMQIFDNLKNKIYDIWGDFDKICETNNLPKKLFLDSLKNNSKPISYPTTKCGKTLFINKKYEYFLGWYMTLEK